MIVFDRILNKEIKVSEIEHPILLGRYLFKKNNDTNYLLNDSKLKNKDFLVPYDSTNGKLTYETQEIKVNFQENTLLNDEFNSLVKHSLIDISKELKNLNDLKQLKSVNIILRNFDGRLEISEFEVLL